MTADTGIAKEAPIAPSPSLPFEQILGLRFFNGSAAEAVEFLCANGGYVVVPAAPALVQIASDAADREALLHADLVIADSGAMVLLWKLLQRRNVSRISGLKYLRLLFQRLAEANAPTTFWVLPNAEARDKTLRWLPENRIPISADNLHVAADYRTSSADLTDPQLLTAIEQRRPAHIIIAVGGVVQEKLGYYLASNLEYRPAIHCIGAALGFLTGHQRPIPDWADRLYLGWLIRLARDPSLYGRRFWAAHRLPGLIARYGSALPPLAASELPHGK